MTTYVDHVLEPSETVRYRTTISWIIYVLSLLLDYGSNVFARGGEQSCGRGNSHSRRPGGDQQFSLSLVPALGNRPAVTDRRVIIKHGFIRRATPGALSAIGPEAGLKHFPTLSRTRRTKRLSNKAWSSRSRRTSAAFMAIPSPSAAPIAPRGQVYSSARRHC